VFHCATQQSRYFHPYRRAFAICGRHRNNGAGVRADAAARMRDAGLPEGVRVRIAIGFATCGRADVLGAALQQVTGQTRAADRVIVCYTKPADIAGIDEQPRHFFIQSSPGLPRQRNVIVDLAQDCDVLLFLDDDFLMAPLYVEAVAAAMERDANIVVATGLPIADDVKGPGLTVAQGLALIDGDGADFDAGWETAPHGYGCNMAIRLAAARAHGVRFDERLPLYGWSEDVDFTHRLGRYGRIVKLHGARGVHLGVKHGRSSGRRLGYSQVANPLYLQRKGSYSWRRAAGSVGRNVAANLVHAVLPEPYIDRRGRLLGNMLAMADLCRGRMSPERVLEL
jgi:GT2 family glycosyltransferase